MYNSISAVLFSNVCILRCCSLCLCFVLFAVGVLFNSIRSQRSPIRPIRAVLECVCLEPGVPFELSPDLKVDQNF